MLDFDFQWTTEHCVYSSSQALEWYLANVNMLDIRFVKGMYAEGTNAKGEIYSLTASSEGVHNHTVEITLLEHRVIQPKTKYAIQEHLTEALNMIEDAIKEEPEYVGDYAGGNGYNGVKGYIEHALDALSFPIHD